MSNNNSNSNNNSKRNNDVEECKPTFNAVALAEPKWRRMAMETQETQEPQLQRASQYSKSAALELRKESPEMIAKLQLQQRKSLHAPMPSPTVWKIEPLLAIPEYYQLERCHVELQSVSAAAVAERICKCLQNESIAGVYVDSEPQTEDGQATIEAETSEGVQFSIRCWKGAATSSVVVEIQRTSGCCFGFCQAAKAVLRASKGIAKSQSAPQLGRPLCLPPSCTEDEKADVEDGLRIVKSMMQSKDRLDCNILAMESLVQLSSSSACAARCILAGKGDFVSGLVTLIVSSPSNASKQSLTDHAAAHKCTMRRHALAVVANCLTALASESPSEVASLVSESDLCSEATLLALVEEVSQAAERPHEACHAMKALTVLVGQETTCKNRLHALISDRLLKVAQGEGACRHADLGLTAKKLQTVMGHSN